MAADTADLLTAREALTKSYNIPAVKAYVDILDQQTRAILEENGFYFFNRS